MKKCENERASYIPLPPPLAPFWSDILMGIKRRTWKMFGEFCLSISLYLSTLGYRKCFGAVDDAKLLLLRKSNRGGRVGTPIFATDFPSMFILVTDSLAPQRSPFTARFADEGQPRIEGEMWHGELRRALHSQSIQAPRRGWMLKHQSCIYVGLTMHVARSWRFEMRGLRRRSAYTKNFGSWNWASCGEAYDQRATDSEGKFSR